MAWRRLMLLVATVLVLGGCEQSPPAVSADRPEIQRRIKYGFTLSNPSGEVVRNAIVNVYVPESAEGAQVLVDVAATLPFETVRRHQRPEELQFVIDEIAPYGIKDVWITATVGLHAQRAKTGGGDARKYLASSRFVESTDPLVVQKVSELRGSSDIESLRNVYGWIVEHIQDNGYVKEDKGAVYALTTGTGDCTEQMYLMMAMVRALGVPARGVAGFVQPSDGVVRAADYHNWAEAFIDGAWRVVDPLKEKFLVDESDYVALTYLDDDGGAGTGAQGVFQARGSVDVVFK